MTVTGKNWLGYHFTVGGNKSFKFSASFHFSIVSKNYCNIAFKLLLIKHYCYYLLYLIRVAHIRINERKQQVRQPAISGTVVHYNLKVLKILFPYFWLMKNLVSLKFKIIFRKRTPKTVIFKNFKGPLFLTEWR